jgi:phage-related holin
MLGSSIMILIIILPVVLSAFLFELFTRNIPNKKRWKTLTLYLITSVILLVAGIILLALNQNNLTYGFSVLVLWFLSYEAIGYLIDLQKGGYRR